MRPRSPRPRSVASTPSGPTPPARAAGHETLYGLRAIRAIWVRRPGDLVRIGHLAELGRDLEDLLAWARASGVPARVLSERELAAAAGTQNHEGLVAEVKERRWASSSELADALVEGGGALLALDRVRNPYNVGAILRSAAFFGLTGVLLGAPAPHPALAPDAVRVAEGGAEDLLLGRTTDLAQTLSKLRARGVRVLGAESDGDASVFGFAFERPTVVVVGHEREGLSERVRATCQRLLTLPAPSRPAGGLVGSLNVAVATGIVCAELARTVRRTG